MDRRHLLFWLQAWLRNFQLYTAIVRNTYAMAIQLIRRTTTL